MTKPLHVLGTLFKMHASCHYTHSVFESLHGLRDRVPPGEVAASPCGCIPTSSGPATSASRTPAWPGSSACASWPPWPWPRAGPEEFTAETVRDPLLRDLRAKVEVVPDDRLHHFTCQAVLRAGDGRRYEGSHNAGQPAWRHRPAEQTAALLEKFAGLTGPVLGAARSAELAEAIMHLEEVPDVSALPTAWLPVAVPIRRRGNFSHF